VSTRETVELRVKVVVDVDWLAEQFAALTDDGQVQFFCRAAEKLGDAIDAQAQYIGRHLASCECSTDLGRRLVGSIVDAMTELPVHVSGAV
jgi:hypothetical protein